MAQSYDETKCNNDQSKSDMIGHLSNEPKKVILCTVGCHKES